MLPVAVFVVALLPVAVPVGKAAHPQSSAVTVVGGSAHQGDCSVAGLLLSALSLQATVPAASQCVPWTWPIAVVAHFCAGLLLLHSAASALSTLRGWPFRRVFAALLLAAYAVSTVALLLVHGSAPRFELSMSHLTSSLLTRHMEFGSLTRIGACFAGAFVGVVTETPPPPRGLRPARQRESVSNVRRRVLQGRPAGRLITIAALLCVVVTQFFAELSHLYGASARTDFTLGAHRAGFIAAFSGSLVLTMRTPGLWARLRRGAAKAGVAAMARLSMSALLWSPLGMFTVAWLAGQPLRLSPGGLLLIWFLGLAPTAGLSFCFFALVELPARRLLHRRFGPLSESGVTWQAVAADESAIELTEQGGDDSDAEASDRESSGGSAGDDASDDDSDSDAFSFASDLDAAQVDPVEVVVTGAADGDAEQLLRVRAAGQLKPADAWRSVVDTTTPKGGAGEHGVPLDGGGDDDLDGVSDVEGTEGEDSAELSDDSASDAMSDISIDDSGTEEGSGAEESDDGGEASDSGGAAAGSGESSASEDSSDSDDAALEARLKRLARAAKRIIKQLGAPFSEAKLSVAVEMAVRYTESLDSEDLLTTDGEADMDATLKMLLRMIVDMAVTAPSEGVAGVGEAGAAT